MKLDQSDSAHVQVQLQLTSTMRSVYQGVSVVIAATNGGPQCDTLRHRHHGYNHSLVVRTLDAQEFDSCVFIVTNAMLQCLLRRYSSSK